jgi:hypothetical protein
MQEYMMSKIFSLKLWQGLAYSWDAVKMCIIIPLYVLSILAKTVLPQLILRHYKPPHRKMIESLFY